MFVNFAEKNQPIKRGRKQMYDEMIVSATGCDRAEVREITEIMRDDIFHSTLDWQTREQLQEAAVLAYIFMKDIEDE